MKKLHLFILTLLGAFAFVACDTNINEDDVEGAYERIVFALNGQEPITAAPGETVNFKFTISYSEGLASVVTSLDGEEVEGSRQEYSDAPTTVDYAFEYTVKANHFGETLNFVFTATAVNGYSQSVDSPVWITANAVEFTVAIPENAPEEVYSDGTVSFEAKVECGNMLKSIEVFKNDVLYASKADFADQKTFNYPFTYTPAAEDVGGQVVFRFVATDVKDNTTEAYYTVTVVKADAVGKMLYQEIFNTSMSVSTTTAFDTAEGGVSGGGATQFEASNIQRYNTFFLPNPDDPEGEPVANTGAMEGCTVYDEDVTALTYTSDGVDACLSKYVASSVAHMSGTYLWYRKAKKGWLQVDGIKLHGATSFKLTYSQSGGSIKVEYSLDGGTTWTEAMATSSAAEMHEQKFTIPQSSDTISLRFAENDGTAHARIDNIKFVEVL